MKTNTIAVNFVGNDYVEDRVNAANLPTNEYI